MTIELVHIEALRCMPEPWEWVDWKGCPICNAPPVRVEVVRIDESTLWRVRCMECGTQTVPFRSREDAVAGWNKR